MSSGYWVLMASPQPAFIVSQAAAFLFCSSWNTYTHSAKKGICTKNAQTRTHSHSALDTWTSHSYWFMALGEKHIDKYLEYLPIEIVKLNWAELRQMRRSKLNKQSSLLGDSTMVIRVSCELPYIIYGCAVGCLQLNRPTVHWLGILWEGDS